MSSAVELPVPVNPIMLLCIYSLLEILLHIDPKFLPNNILLMYVRLPNSHAYLDVEAKVVEEFLLPLIMP